MITLKKAAWRKQTETTPFHSSRVPTLSSKDAQPSLQENLQKASVASRCEKRSRAKSQRTVRERGVVVAAASQVQVLANIMSE